MLLNKKLTSVALATTLALSGLAMPTASNAELSGNIGVHSKYLLRGIFEENSGTAVQGGFDWSGDSGFYLGYWGSNLGYSYDASGTDPYTSTGFENDFYGGFAGEAGGIGYDIGLIQYYYISVDDSDLTELTAKVSMGDGYVGMQYLLTDGWWGNSGDIYWKAGYAFGLPSDFGLAFDLGYYTYSDDDNEKLTGSVACTACVTTSTSGFRHLNITLSHPVATTGADMYLQYTVAGEDRTAFDYDDTIVMGMTYGF